VFAEFLCRRLGGPYSRSGICGEEKNRLPLPGTEPRYLDDLAAILIDLSLLSNTPQCVNSIADLAETSSSSSSSYEQHKARYVLENKRNNCKM
jgi:hypothetical protein